MWEHCCFCYNTIEVAPLTCRATDGIGKTRHRITCGPTTRRGGEIGKHRGLKIPRLKGLAGSSPAPGIAGLDNWASFLDKIYAVRLDAMGALNRTGLNSELEGKESVRRHGGWLCRTPAFSKQTDEVPVVRSSMRH